MQRIKNKKMARCGVGWVEAAQLSAEFRSANYVSLHNGTVAWYRTIPLWFNRGRKIIFVDFLSFFLFHLFIYLFLLPFQFANIVGRHKPDWRNITNMSALESFIVLLFFINLIFLFSEYCLIYSSIFILFISFIYVLF